jgi:hypothetical protein
MLNKELVQYQDKLFWVYRRVKSTQIKEGSVSDLRDFWLCDVAVKSRNNNDDFILFLREIEEAKIVS